MERLALIYYIVYAILMICMSIYSIRLYSTRNYLINNSSRTRIILFIVLILLIMSCATGDYWAYRLWYDYGIDNVHFEPIWETVRSLIPWGFNYFKLVLWGGGFILFTLMCRWHKSDLLIAYSLFALFYIINYSYARASIAYILIQFAYYIIVRLKDQKLKNVPLLIVIAIICAVLGFSMHRSMPILLATLVVAFFVKPHKRVFIILLILFPIVSIIFNTVLYPYLLTNYSADAETTRLMDVYLHDDSRGISAFIQQLIQHLPILLLFIFSMVNILKRKDVSQYVKKIAFTAFFIIYFAFLFYTLREGNGLVLFYRTMNMAYPFIILSIAYSMKYINNMYKLTLIVVIFRILYTFLVIYQVLVNPDYLYNQIYERYIY